MYHSDFLNCNKCNNRFCYNIFPMISEPINGVNSQKSLMTTEKERTCKTPSLPSGLSLGWGIEKPCSCSKSLLGSLPRLPGNAENKLGYTCLHQQHCILPDRLLNLALCTCVAVKRLHLVAAPLTTLLP